MQQPIDRLIFVDKSLSGDRLADVIRALQQNGKGDSPLLSVMTGIDLKQLQQSNPTLESLVWRTVDIDGGNLVNIPENGVFFVTVAGQRMVVKATFTETRYDENDEISMTRSVNRLQICAHTIEEANSLMRWFLHSSSKHSIFRGQMLHVSASSSEGSRQTIEIVNRPPTSSDDIVLPDEILKLTQTLIQSRIRHRDQLGRLGHSTRLGLLFYGPPGTGKTLVTKLLLSQMPDHTVVVPTDLAPGTLRECFRLATYLEPTAVVIEDVDLLATNRTEANGRLDGLQELMNEMDGLSSNSDTLVILSTNRPDVLEPALASRPGRVSQAIEFPLPDLAARLKLLRLFLRQTGEINLDLNSWATRTDKASPAFLQELCKRAIMIVCEKTTSPETAVSDEDIREAMHQLVITGGQLNANVLGFPDFADHRPQA